MNMQYSVIVSYIPWQDISSFYCLYTTIDPELMINKCER